MVQVRRGDSQLEVRTLGEDRVLSQEKPLVSASSQQVLLDLSNE